MNQNSVMTAKWLKQTLRATRTCAAVTLSLRRDAAKIHAICRQRHVAFDSRWYKQTKASSAEKRRPVCATHRRPEPNDRWHTERCEMSIDYTKRAKQCCTREHKRLVEQLDVCDSRSKTSASRHRCYRTAARRSGSRSRKCMIGA
jgi:hypothetical protein